MNRQQQINGNARGGKYVAPNRRGQGQSMATKPTPKMDAPKTADFPTLSSNTLEKVVPKTLSWAAIASPPQESSPPTTEASVVTKDTNEKFDFVEAFKTLLSEEPEYTPKYTPKRLVNKRFGTSTIDNTNDEEPRDFSHFFKHHSRV